MTIPTPLRDSAFVWLPVLLVAVLGLTPALAAPGGNGRGAAHGLQTSAGEGPDGTTSCDPTHHSDTGHGANTDGPDNAYHTTCEPEHEPGNGQEFGPGLHTGRPCAGCVGNADDKNPPGQHRDGGDHNSGYECDGRDRPADGQQGNGNHGIGDENPAHTGCASTVPLSIALCVDLTNDADGDYEFTDDELADGAGAPVRERITVRNCGDEPLVVDAVTITTDGGTPVAVCPRFVGLRLEPGASDTCTTTLDDHAPAAGDLRVDVASVSAVHPDDASVTTSATDATVVGSAS